MADLLTVRDLKVSIAVDAGIIKAVDGVSFRIPEGGTVALVGESGSGKSVIAQTIMGILPRIARIDSGEILFRDPRTPGEEIDLSRMKGPPMRRIAETYDYVLVWGINLRASALLREAGFEVVHEQGRMRLYENRRKGWEVDAAGRHE